MLKKIFCENFEKNSRKSNHWNYSRNPPKELLELVLKHFLDECLDKSMKEYAEKSLLYSQLSFIALNL